MFKGKEVLGELVLVQETREQWNQYQLEDGSTLRLKTVATEIYRVEGEYDQEGNPVYVIKSANILSVIAPEELKRKG